MKLLPTKKEWRDFFKFNAKVQIDLILASTDYDERVKKSREILDQTIELINDCDEIYEKRQKDIQDEK